MLQVEIIGNIGNDAQVKDFNGKKYISFNVAHSEKFTTKQGVETERTTWVSVLRTGESGLVQYLKKGTPVFVRGDLSFKQYQNQHHNSQTGVNCLSREIQLLPGGKRDEKQQDAAAPAQGDAPAEATPPAIELTGEGDKSDLPF